MNEELEVVKYYSLPEAAKALGVSPSAISHWLNANEDIKGQYTAKAVHNGRMRIVITAEGLTVLATVKGGKSKTANGEIISSIKKGKQAIAEKAIEKSQPSNTMQILDTLMLQIQAMREQELRVDNHEERIVELEGDITKMPISDGQRTRLNERVRLLAFDLQVPFPAVWKQLHDMTGRKTINDYTFQDYGIAITYLKGTYKKNHIAW